MKSLGVDLLAGGVLNLLVNFGCQPINFPHASAPQCWPRDKPRAFQVRPQPWLCLPRFSALTESGFELVQTENVSVFELVFVGLVSERYRFAEMLRNRKATGLQRQAQDGSRSLAVSRLSL